MFLKPSRFFALLFFAAGILLFAAPNAMAASLTSVTVSPDTDGADNLMGQSGATWNFTIDNATALTAATDAVEITFPDVPNGSPWNLNGISATSTALGSDAVEFATTSIPVFSDRTVVVMVSQDQTDAANNFTIALSGVGNPTADLAALGSYSWSVRTCVLTTAGNPAAGCASDLDSAAAGSAAFARRGGVIDGWTFTPSDYSANATGVEFAVTFTASTTLSVGEKIHLNFPVGFDLSGATTSDQIIIDGGTAAIASTTLATSTDSGLNQIILTLSAGTIDPAATSTASFTVGNITNPTKGAYQNLRAFTTTANGGLVDGAIFGMESRNDFNPPPVDSIQIGGTNTIIGTVKVRNADGTLRTVTSGEAAQMQVGMGSPDMMFFAGTKVVGSDGSFSYGNLLNSTYIMFVMPFNTSDTAFFGNYLQPNMLQINVTGNETATVTPTFVIPDGVIEGSLTGGPADATGVFVRSYSGAMQSFSPLFTSASYASEGLNSSGTGYFKIPIKTNNTWNISFMTASVLTSGGTQYWTPSVSPVFIESGTSTTTPDAYSFTVADKTLNVTLRNGTDNSVIDESNPPAPCLNIKRSGSEMMGPSGNEVCSTTTVDGVSVYQMTVPAGAFVIEVMMPGAGFKEEPVNISSSDTTVSKTIIVEKPTGYISGTVKDSDDFAIQGVSIMAQGSDGNFRQTLSGSDGTYKLYVPSGTYRVDAFAPSYGPLTPKTGVTVASGSDATSQDFTISAASFKKITGRIYTDANGNGSYDSGEAVYEGVNINAFNSTGGNSAMSRGDGTYTLRVPSASGYTVDAWSRSFGHVGTLASVDATSDTSGNNFAVPAQGYLQITITGGNTYGVTEVFARAYDPVTGKGSGSDSWTATSSDADLVTKFALPAGDYTVNVGAPSFGDLTSLPANIDATTTTIVAGSISSLTIALPSMATLSGTTEASATVWASRIDGAGKYKTTADSAGAYSMQIPSGYSYNVGASLPGYLNSPVAVALSSDATQNLTLTASAYSVSGTVSDSGGSALNDGFVWAVKAGNSGWTGSEINSDGSYTLDIDSGNWVVYADAPCYDASSGTTQSGSGTLNISLSATASCSVDVPDMQSIVPSAGGAISQSDITINIPPNALGTGSSNVSLSVATPNVVPPSTLNASPLGNSAKSILVSNSSGGNVTTLNNSIEISLTYSEGDIPSGATESDLQLAYWNTTTQTWDPVAATLDVTNNTLTAKVNHLTDFAPIVPTADSAPSAPSGLAAAKNGAGGVNLSWNAVSGADNYLLYRDTSSGGDFPYLTTVSETSHSDTGLSAGTAYYYKVSASNSSGESSASSAVSVSTCSSVSNGTVSGSSCSLSCDSGYRASGGACLAAGGGGAPGSVSPGASVPVPVMIGAAKADEKSAAPVEETPARHTQREEIASGAGKAMKAISAAFVKTLKPGMKNGDIKRLQKILNSDPDTKVAESGAGSPGNETERFGMLTGAAVKKFQCKYDIVCFGNEKTTGYGIVGPKTRAKLAEVFGGRKTEEKSFAAPSAAKQKQKEALIQQIKTQVKQLQEQLTKLLQELTEKLRIQIEAAR
ncbi:MAG: hypothetical protein GXP44_02790 [bacterium]|nr:hypothetical protein [bacterium]